MMSRSGERRTNQVSYQEDSTRNDSGQLVLSASQFCDKENLVYFTLNQAEFCNISVKYADFGSTVHPTNTSN